MYKRLLYSVLFIALLAVAQTLIARYGFNWDAQVEKIDSALQNPSAVLFFGDSVIKDSSETDADHSSIAEFLGSRMPGTPVEDLSQGASDAKLFDAMVEYIAKADPKPKAIIIPVNLRSFSPEWHRRPGYQFERQKFVLRQPAFLGYFFQPLAVFHALKIPAVSQTEFLNTPVRYGTSTVGPVKDFEGAGTVRSKYIYDYMGTLNRNHEELLALTDALRRGKQAGIAMYVYITPVDYRGGAALVGKDFIPQIKSNTAIVCAEAALLGVPCLNLTFSLGTEHFNFIDYPNEHLKEAGRHYVAQQLYLNFFK